MNDNGTWHDEVAIDVGSDGGRHHRHNGRRLELVDLDSSQLNRELCNHNSSSSLPVLAGGPFVVIGGGDDRRATSRLTHRRWWTLGCQSDSIVGHSWQVTSARSGWWWGAQLYYQRNGAKLDQFHTIVPRYSRQLSLDRESTVWIKLFLGLG